MGASPSPPPVDKKKEQAKEILFKALNDINLLDSITERACIRWADGYSDGLFDAVLCNMGISTGERTEELKPQTKWVDEMREIFGTDVKLSDKAMKMLGGVITSSAHEQHNEKPKENCIEF